MKSCFVKNQKKAFSLIELSIVIIIISILITGALSVSVNAINSSKNKLTKERMAEIYKALGNYVVANKALPCPAPLTDLKSTTSTYGTSATTTTTQCDTTPASNGVFQSGTSTNLVRGMLPVKTLGLALDMAEDGFGSKFEYIVDRNYTKASTGTTPTSGAGDFGTSSTANIIINDKPGSSAIALTSASGTSSANNNTAAVFAIISLGANKSGAYGVDVASRTTVSSDSDEATNTPSGAGTTYTSSLYASSGNSDVFDDIVFYKTRNALVSDFNSLQLVPCQSTTETLYGTTVTWPLAWFSQVAVSTTACPGSYTKGVTYPTKRCGAYGSWDVVINPCLN